VNHSEKGEKQEQLLKQKQYSYPQQGAIPSAFFPGQFSTKLPGQF
jgi:hypothetical protein